MRSYENSNKNLARIMRRFHLDLIKNVPSIKFVVRIARNHAETMEFDRKNGNTKWADAKKLDFNQLYEYDSFEFLGSNA